MYIVTLLAARSTLRSIKCHPVVLSLQIPPRHQSELMKLLRLNLNSSEGMFGRSSATWKGGISQYQKQLLAHASWPMGTTDKLADHKAVRMDGLPQGASPHKHCSWYHSRWTSNRQKSTRGNRNKATGVCGMSPGYGHKTLRLISQDAKVDLKLLIVAIILIYCLLETINVLFFLFLSIFNKLIIFRAS